MRRSVFALVLMFALVASAGVSVLGQRPDSPPGQNEFVPVKDLPAQEGLPAAPLVMVAYAFVWVALVVYVWSLSRRMRKVQAEIADLRKRGIARQHE